MPLDLKNWGVVSGSGAVPVIPSPPDPSTIPGILAWFDPSSGLSIDGSNNVLSWTSRAGIAAQTISPGAMPPAYSAAGLLGMPCVSWGAGVNRALEGASNVAASIGATSAMSIFLVGTPTNATSSVSFWSVSRASGSQGYRSLGLTSAEKIQFEQLPSSGSVATYTTTLTAPISACLIGFMTLSGTSVAKKYRLNGTEQTNTSLFSTMGAGARFVVGAKGLSSGYGNDYRGTIGDICVYDHSLTSGEVTTLETYLRWKYPGLP